MRAPALPVIARKPELQPLTDTVAAFMRDNRVQSIPALCEMIYGRKDNGAIAGCGNLYPVVHGQRRPNTLMADMIKDRVGLDLTPFASEPGPNARMPGRRPGTGRAAAAVIAYERVHGKEEPPDLPSSPPPRRPRLLPPPAGDTPKLALSIGADGRGSLAFHLVDVPAAEIMRAYNVLQSLGLIAEVPPREDAA